MGYQNMEQKITEILDIVIVILRCLNSTQKRI